MPPPDPNALLPKDIATITISATSATVAATAAAWQFLLYKLSGSRLYVELRPAFVDIYGLEGRGPQKGWNIGRRPSSMQYGRYPIALVQLRVVNIGRTATSVEDLALDVRSRGDRREYWPFYRVRKQIQGHSAPLRGTMDEDVFRLEPGQAAFTYFDLKPILRGELSVPPKRNWAGIKGHRTVIRASAKPSGRRTRKSAWRKRWVVRRFDDLFAFFEVRDKAASTYRVLWEAMLPYGRPLDEIRACFFDAVGAMHRNEGADGVREAIRTTIGDDLGIQSLVIANAVAREWGSHPESDWVEVDFTGE